METLVAIVVFAALLAIALGGLALSNRQARLNNASRNAGGATIHPHDQWLGRTRTAQLPADRR